MEYIRQKRCNCPHGNDNAQHLKAPTDNRSSAEEAPQEEDDGYLDECHGSGPELLDDPGALYDSPVSIRTRRRRIWNWREETHIVEAILLSRRELVGRDADSIEGILIAMSVSTSRP